MIKKLFYITLLIFALCQPAKAGPSCLIDSENSTPQLIPDNKLCLVDAENLVESADAKKTYECCNACCVDDEKMKFEEKSNSDKSSELKATVDPNLVSKEGSVDKSIDPNKTTIPANPTAKDVLNNTTLGVKYKFWW